MTFTNKPGSSHKTRLFFSKQQITERSTYDVQAVTEGTSFEIPERRKGGSSPHLQRHGERHQTGSGQIRDKLRQGPSGPGTHGQGGRGHVPGVRFRVRRGPLRFGRGSRSARGQDEFL